MVADSLDIPVTRQCDLLGLARSSLHYRPHRDATAETFEQRLLNAIDSLCTPPASPGPAWPVKIKTGGGRSAAESAAVAPVALRASSATTADVLPLRTVSPYAGPQPVHRMVTGWPHTL